MLVSSARIQGPREAGAKLSASGVSCDQTLWPSRSTWHGKGGGRQRALQGFLTVYAGAGRVSTWAARRPRDVCTATML